jgi:hypothetical protein
MRKKAARGFARQHRGARTFCAATILVAASLAGGAASAQEADFDPLAPFDGITEVGEWLSRFQTEAELDPADPWQNLTSNNWWNRGWEGQWMTAVAEGKTFEQFYTDLEGANGNSVIIESPYAFQSAEEHWNAWLEAANGGTEHTRDTLPDWSGDWTGGARLVAGGTANVGDVWDATAESNKPAFEQMLQAELEGRHWWPADTCLPNGYFRDGWSARYLMIDGTSFLMAEDQPLNEYRVTYTDGRGFPSSEYTIPGWYGQSQAFWDEDELIVWVKDIIPLSGGHGLPEYTAQLQIIERWKRIGDEIVADITMYDAEAFAFPWHDVATYELREDWTMPSPTHNECVSTNNVYHDEHGRIADYGPEDPLYYDIFDPRPWATNFERSEAAKAEGILPDAPSFRSTFPTQQ